VDSTPAIHRNSAPYMLNEIFEQPSTLENTVNYYEDKHNHRVLANALHLLRSRARILIAASGSSRHAGVVASFMLSRIAGLDVTVVSSGEYFELPRNIRTTSSLLVISQSGESSDTMNALCEAKSLGCPVVALTNSSDSSMSKQSSIALLTPVGRELAIPATKSFTGQLLVLLLLALTGIDRTTDRRDAASLSARIDTLPERLKARLPLWNHQAQALAQRYSRASSFYFLGSGMHAGIAAEGALKLKEAAYRHAEAYTSGEVEHGPNALITSDMPIFLIEPHRLTGAAGNTIQSPKSTLSERLQKQGAHVIEVVSALSFDADRAELRQIEIEAESPYIQTIFEVVPLQMFACHSGVVHNISVDRPRNLTKAVIL
jgi:glucosamine--fructose-6-phosphate aminotransferase (isomerizing)